MKHLALALALFMAVPAAADPNPQLVLSVENRLARYGLQADVSQFATSTVAQLHFALTRNGDGYLTKRRKLQNILRNAVFK